MGGARVGSSCGRRPASRQCGATAAVRRRRPAPPEPTRRDDGSRRLQMASPAETAAMRRALELAAPRRRAAAAPTRASAACCSTPTARSSARATTAAPARRTPRSTPWPPPGPARRRRDRRRHPRAVQPHRPDRSVRRRAARGRGRAGSSSRQADPNPVAAGGADRLRAAGVDVEGGLLDDEAPRLNEAWRSPCAHGRPFVTWKLADDAGRPRGRRRRDQPVDHRARRPAPTCTRCARQCDAVLVGTGTVLADDPRLTARDRWQRRTRLPRDGSRCAS